MNDKMDTSAQEDLGADFKKALDEGWLPIREVARQTGVNAITLRAWERRYGLIQPTRTDSGHRLYSQADIDDIRRILGWLERGVAVSKVASILVRSQALVEDNGDEQSARLRWRQQIHEAVLRFDGTRLHRLFDKAFASHSLDQVFGEIFMPVWHDLAAGQSGYGQRAFGQASEWLFFDQFMRSRVFVRLQLSRMPRSRSTLPSGCCAAAPGAGSGGSASRASIAAGSRSRMVWASARILENIQRV